MIFVDTSFWVALAVSRDRHHAEARSLLEIHGDSSLFTSNHVRGETWTYLRRRGGHAAAVEFLDRLDRSTRVILSTVLPETEVEAWRWLRRHDEREYSFVDSTSFALMRSMRSRRALAFDGYFSAAGFEEIRGP
ncbi:MAG: type II toxin-antitoxin system VapC family toxin [Acidimicrobiales bacterium]